MRRIIFLLILNLFLLKLENNLVNCLKTKETKKENYLKNIKINDLIDPFTKFTRRKVLKLLLKSIKKSKLNKKDLFLPKILKKKESSNYQLKENLLPKNIISYEKRMNFEGDYIPIIIDLDKNDFKLLNEIYKKSEKNLIKKENLRSEKKRINFNKKDEALEINIPLNNLKMVSLYIDNQLNTYKSQKLINQFISKNLNQLKPRSDLQKKNLFFNSKLKIEDNLQPKMTKALGIFVGDIVGVIVEDILHKKGDKIADGIRAKVGDFATIFINKTNLALNLTFKNLSKIVLKKKI